MNAGINTSGTMPPPNMAIKTPLPHAAPLTDSALRPVTDMASMIPTKEHAMLNAASASRNGLPGRIPRT